MSDAVKLPLTIKFTGEDADDHFLPAYEAAQSLYGNARALTIAVNYLHEGKVRKRKFSHDSFQLNFLATKPGSFETLFEVVYQPEVMALALGLPVSIAGNLLTPWLKTIFNRAIGKPGESRIGSLEDDGSLNSGDVQALVDGIEPALREVHQPIGAGARNVVIINGDNNIVSMDAASKEYVNTSIRIDSVDEKYFSVGGYNSNSKNGRVFDYETGKTIPFYLENDRDPLTLQAILESHRNYALRNFSHNKSEVAIKFNKIVAPDGRVKKIVVLKARTQMSDL